MTGANKVSDEMLNAFVDGELDKHERERMFTLIEQDPCLAQQVCELMHLKEQLRAARPEYTGPLAHGMLQNQSRILLPVALVFVLFAVGVFQYYFSATPKPHEADRFVRGLVAQHALKGEIKLVLQVSRDDAAVMERTLEQAETLARLPQKLDKPVRVELIAFGQGLALFRADRSAYAKRIQRLHRRYDNLMLVACQSTLNKHQKGSLENIRVLPGVVIVPSGPEEVALRRTQGWTIL